MEAQISPEQARIRSLAEEYRDRGYEVLVEPESHQLPDFLSGYRPDLIISRGDERTIVEVKSRRSLATEAQARDIARLVEGRPGWNFELVIVGDEVPPLAGTVTFNHDDVRRSIQEARDLIVGGFTGPALLIGWAASEAVLRLLLTAEGIELRRLTPDSLLKQAVEEGLVSREEYRTLSDAMVRRNALAHGFQGTEITSSFVSGLLDLAERLLNEASSPQSA